MDLVGLGGDLTHLGDESAHLAVVELYRPSRPVDRDRSAWGLGRARTWTWPDSVVEVTEGVADELAVDLVVLQRPAELHGVAERWLGGRRPERDVAAVYVEHNAPQGRIDQMRHPAAGAPGITVVHVTAFNELFWDCGTSPTLVIEHGIVDPGYRYTGELPRLAVVINDAERRNRVTGTDLLSRFGEAGPVDLFGMGAERLGGIADLPQHALHAEMARRRVYVHPIRWTSLRLALLEAMHLGMPVVAVGTTEVTEAVPHDAGVVSTSVPRLVDAARVLLDDPDWARQLGQAARAAATARYGLDRFLKDWDATFREVAR